MKSFYSNGKLLLTGEYAILDGAIGLAVPTKYGQLMLVDEHTKQELVWKSFDHNGSIWFKGIFSLDLKEIIFGMANPVSQTLLNILREAKKLNPNFLSEEKGFSVMTKLDFAMNWGLGSSSTLINSIAEWAEVDAFKLLKNSFGGSGYDIACAQNNHPILYRLKDEVPVVKKSSFNPSFREHLYFIHLNKKQNSRKEIVRYSNQNIDKEKLISQLTEITEQIEGCEDLENFERFMNDHENILSAALQIAPVKESLFQDFHGSIKSLGAWGGDFVLAMGNEKTPEYFKKKGYTIVIPYNKMIL